MNEVSHVDGLARMLLKVGVSEESMIVGCGILSEIFDPETQETNKGWSKSIGKNGSAKDIVNLVPRDSTGMHSDLLIIACEGRDNFMLHMNQAIGLCIDGVDKLKAVVIATDYWDETYFNMMLKPAFKAIYEKLGIISFLYSPGKWEFSALNF